MKTKVVCPTTITLNLWLTEGFKVILHHGESEQLCSSYLQNVSLMLNTTFLLLTLNQITSSSRLEELFLCLNGYSAVSQSNTSCPSLRLLQITDNQLQEWAEVRKLGMMYPSLSTLVLANNSVDSVGDTQETLQRLFPNLRSINLNNSGLRWMTVFHLV